MLVQQYQTTRSYQARQTNDLLQPANIKNTPARSRGRSVRCTRLRLITRALSVRQRMNVTWSTRLHRQILSTPRFSRARALNAMLAFVLSTSIALQHRKSVSRFLNTRAVYASKPTSSRSQLNVTLALTTTTSILTSAHT